MNDKQQAPFNDDAERDILGAMLFSRQASADAIYLLETEDFFKPQHRAIFETIKTLFLDGHELTPVIVADRLARSGQLDDAGGMAFLAELMSENAGSAIRATCGIVLRWSNQRKLARIIEGGQAGTDEELLYASAQAEELVNRMRRVSYEQRPSLIGQDLGSVLEELEARSLNGTPTGLLTGIPGLDKKTGGFKKGQLVIVGARPGMGKTAWMVQVALEAARNERKVAFFSLEMSPEEVRWRALSQDSRVPLWKFSAAALEMDDWARLTKASSRFQKYLITIDGRAEVSPSDIAMEARRLASEHEGLDLIVVDYLQLVKPLRADVQKQEQISDISRSLKLMARQLQVPVIAGSQLSRNLEYRENKRPKLADLRESGALEQDSDLVCFLYRDEVYNPGQGNEGRAELILAKHRNGPTGKVDLHFMKEQAMFYDRSPAAPPPEQERLEATT